MSRVWGIELSHSQQSVLLAMAYFADEHGRNCRPSHPRLAWMTGYSERQISRAINELIEMGIVKIMHLGTNNRPPIYQILIDQGTTKPPYQAQAAFDGEIWDDTLSPQQYQQQTRDDNLSPQTMNRDDTMSPQNTPDVDFVTPGGDTMSPDPINNQLVGRWGNTKPTNQPMRAREKQKPPLNQEQQLALGLLVDPEVGIIKEVAEIIARRLSAPDIYRAVDRWLPDHRAGKVQTGALVRRLQRLERSELATVSLSAGLLDSGLFNRHRLPDEMIATGDTNRRSYRPDEYADIILG